MKKAILFLKLNWQWIIVFSWLTWISLALGNMIDEVDYIEWQVSTRRRDRSSLHSKIDNIESTVEATYNEVMSLTTK